MTAFGRAKREGEDKDITIEIKSVNSRFFDCQVKMPRAYAFLEERIKAHIQKNAVSRAKVDVYVTVDKHTADVESVSVDLELARSYVKALREMGDALGLADDISVMTVARNQDIFTYSRADEDLDGEWERVRSVLDEALVGYGEMRALEGKKAETDIKAKIELVRSYADEVERISHEDTVGYRDSRTDGMEAFVEGKIFP
jgi:uncharacterized protein (TIGR00255 family)